MGKKSIKTEFVCQHSPKLIGLYVPPLRSDRAALPDASTALPAATASWSSWVTWMAGAIRGCLGRPKTFSCGEEFVGDRSTLVHTYARGSLQASENLTNRLLMGFALPALQHQQAKTIPTHFTFRSYYALCSPRDGEPHVILA